MAFKNKNLSVIAYANGFTLWHYASDDAIAATTAAGYFDDVKTLMNVGDIVIISATDKASIRQITVASNKLNATALS